MSSNFYNGTVFQYDLRTRRHYFSSTARLDRAKSRFAIGNALVFNNGQGDRYKRQLA